MDEKKDYIEVCPLTDEKKEDKIAKYMEMSQKDKDWLSQYAKAFHPDVCAGNCEICDAWKQDLEKAWFIRHADTSAKHFQYGLRVFFINFFASLPLALIFSCLYYEKDIVCAFFISLSFALMSGTFGMFPISYEEWLWQTRECTDDLK